MNKSIKYTISGLMMIFVATIFVTGIANAQTPAENMPDNSNTKYTLLEPLPDLSKANDYKTTITFKEYVEYAFNLIIALSAAAAVFMIVFGGFQYMTTDSWKGKSEGLGKVKNALLGLLLVLGSYLLLRTIDPRLVNIPSTLVKPLEIKYDKMLTAFNDHFFDQLAAEMALYHTNMNERKEVVDAARENIKKLVDRNLEITNDLAYILGESYLSPEDINDICNDNSIQGISSLCLEYTNNAINISKEGTKIQLEVVKANFDQSVYATGPSTGSVANKFDAELTKLNAKYRAEYTKLQSAGADAGQLKQLEYYKNYAEALIKLNKVTSPVNDVHSQYLKEQTAASRSIGNAGDALNNIVGFELSKISPLDWLTTSQTEYWKKLTAAQNNFMSESLKIKNEYKTKMDAETYGKFVQLLGSQSKMVQKVVTKE